LGTEDDEEKSSGDFENGESYIWFLRSFAMDQSNGWPNRVLLRRLGLEIDEK
jgi:hypothetical protein